MRSKETVTQENYFETLSRRVYKNNIDLKFRADCYSAFLPIAPRWFSDLEFRGPDTEILGKESPGQAILPYCRELPAIDYSAETLVLVGVALLHKKIGIKYVPPWARLVLFISRVSKNVILNTDMFNRNMPVTSVAYGRLVASVPEHNLLPTLLHRIGLDLLAVRRASGYIGSDDSNKHVTDNRRGIPLSIYLLHYMKFLCYLKEQQVDIYRPKAEESDLGGRYQSTIYDSLRKLNV